MVTSQNTPNLINLGACQRCRRLELKSYTGHNRRKTVTQVLSYIFTNIQLEPFITPKRRHCNVMVLCMCQSLHKWLNDPLTPEENFRPQCTALFPCTWERWSTADRLRLSGLTLNSSISLNQHSCLTGLSCLTSQVTQTHYFTTAWGGGSQWVKQGYRQFWQNEAEHSSWKNWMNYR